MLFHAKDCKSSLRGKELVGQPGIQKGGEDGTKAEVSSALRKEGDIGDSV
jgi:hypothetical protein